MKNEMKHEMGEGKQMRKREREQKGYKAGSKKMKPCKYKTKGKM
jgi:hypothetical protein